MSKQQFQQTPPSYQQQAPPNYQQTVYQQPSATVVVTGTAVGFQAMYNNEWAIDMFSCDNFGGCFKAWFCGPCDMATARTEFDGSDWCFNCMFVGLPAIRTAIRNGYKIRSTPCTELLGVWCGPCSIGQISNEVRLRGRMPRTTMPKEQWNVSLFDMFRDCGVCVYASFLPWCAIAQAREEYDGTPCLQTFYCSSPIAARSVIRVGYNIEGGCCGDICTIMWCGHCAACQLLNEVRSRGPNNGPNVAVPGPASAVKY